MVFWVILIFLAMGWTGCGEEDKTKTTTDQTTGEQMDEVVQLETIAEPMLASIMSAYNSGDYQAYSKDFNQEMKNAVTEEAFTSSRTDMLETIGKYTSHTFVSHKTEKEYEIFQYKAMFEQDEVNITLTLEKQGDTYKVVGLWLSSPKLIAMKQTEARVPAEQRLELESKLGPVLENAIQAWVADDYETWVQDFSEQTKAAITEDEFTEAKQMITNLIGMYQSHELSELYRQEGILLFVYTAKFEKDSKVSLTISVQPTDEGHEIVGFVMNSPTLAEAANQE
jgi:PBP1b-binding outer membrane lipoprotein LpoB